MIGILKRHAGLRVGLISFATTSAILMVAAGFDYGSAKKSTLAEYAAKRAFLNASTASALGTPLYEYDTDIVEASAASLFGDADVVGVVVAEPNGTEVVGFGALTAADKTEITAIEAPGGGQIGQLMVGYTDQNVEAELAAYLRAIVLKSLILVVLLCAVGVAALRSLIGPVLRLEAVVRAFDVRGTAVPVPGRERDDEIGSLARSFATQSEQLKNLFGELEDRVTERTADLEIAVRAAEEASVAKSQFLANMSHEIRTPMNGVLGMTEVLMETELSESQTEFVDTIYKSGNALVTIINDILDFSKIEAGRLELDPTPFNLRSAIEDVALLLSSAAAEKGVELSVRYHPKTPSAVVGDAGRLRQIFTNLVGNAIKFTHEGYVLIDVSGQEGPDGKVALSVKVQDTGIGIAEDKLAAIFDEFTQAEESTTRRFGGTGLGLAISKRLAQAMDGTLDAQSALGVGSVFELRVELPVSELPACETEAVRDLTGARILVVDDLAINRAILNEQLTSWGVAATAVDSGADALAALAEAAAAGAPFDLAILDYQMPAMDGAALARAMREDAATAGTGIVVLSSVDGDANAGVFAEIGVDAYLSKPTKSVQLRRTLGAVLGRGPADTGHAASPAAPACEAAADPSRDGLRILIAEDNEVNRMVVRTMIDGPTRALTFASDGKQAYDRFREEAFDIVLMDVSMPVMDGVEATMAIRAFEAAEGRARTPIVCLSAHALETDKERFLTAGMDDYLAKPVSKAALTAKLEAIEGRSGRMSAA